MSHFLYRIMKNSPVLREMSGVASSSVHISWERNISDTPIVRCMIFHTDHNREISQKVDSQGRYSLSSEVSSTLLL